MESVSGSPIFWALCDVSFACQQTAGTSQSGRFRITLQTSRGRRSSQWLPIDGCDGHAATPPSFAAGAVISSQIMTFMAEAPDALSGASVEMENANFKVLVPGPTLRVINPNWVPKTTANPRPSSVPTLEILDAAR